MRNDLVYDIEVYPNVFTCSVMHAGTGESWIFEISFRRNDIREFLKFMYAAKQMPNVKMVGYNNIGFDYPVIHEILNWGENVTLGIIYEKAQIMIKGTKDEQFRHTVWPRDRFIEQIDLYKIHHFDNKAKATSLKLLQFNMRSRNIQDLPYKPGTYLTAHQIDELRSYNMHDVVETARFLQQSMDKITFREELSERYSRDFHNHNDTKVGKDYFIMRLEEANPGACFIKEDGQRKPRQTHREQIVINDILFPYIQFERPEFGALLQWFRQQVIRQTKSMFNGIKQDSLGELMNYADTIKKRKSYKGGRAPTPGRGQWVEKTQSTGTEYLCWREAENLNVVVDGFRFDFGTGGIHGSIDKSAVYSDATHQIIDIDVASFYPAIAIANGCYPEHLGELFAVIYGSLKEERMQYAKGTDVNATLKLALNGTFGDTNNVYSPFYDPQYTMQITINGQLLLCMLSEQLMKTPGLEMIQINTDGLTVRCPREYVNHLYSVCEWWERMTLLDLEYKNYIRMFIRDVNNYIAEDENGKIKRKGTYAYKLPWEEDAELEWHQNHSALVTKKAANAAMLYGANIRQFIMNHNNALDFMLRARVTGKSRLVLHYEQGREKEMQKITRYYIANHGGELVKIMPPLSGQTEERRIGINVGWKVQPCNEIKDSMIESMPIDINYEWYIQEAESLVIS